MFLHVTILSIIKDLYYRKIYMRERERERERKREGERERPILKMMKYSRAFMAPLLYCLKEKDQRSLFFSNHLAIKIKQQKW